MCIRDSSITLFVIPLNLIFQSFQCSLFTVVHGISWILLDGTRSPEHDRARMGRQRYCDKPPELAMLQWKQLSLRPAPRRRMRLGSLYREAFAEWRRRVGEPLEAA